MNILEHNRRAWNRLSDGGIPWGIPVDANVISAATSGHWRVELAGQTEVPRQWFAEDGLITNKDILCLASGGGQQAPILSAAGANVTLLELSDSMIEKDRELAQKHRLNLRCEQGSMTDLSRFGNATFDIVFLPVALCYVPDPHLVWRECARVLRPGGRLLAGMINPLVNLFEENEGDSESGLQVIHRLPFAEIESLSEAERDAAIARDMAFVWSHTLTDLIGGQLDAGFRLLNFAEARRTDSRAPSINDFTSTYVMTAAELHSTA